MPVQLSSFCGQFLPQVRMAWWCWRFPVSVFNRSWDLFLRSIFELHNDYFSIFLFPVNQRWHWSGLGRYLLESWLTSVAMVAILPVDEIVLLSATVPKISWERVRYQGISWIFPRKAVADRRPDKPVLLWKLVPVWAGSSGTIFTDWTEGEGKGDGDGVGVVEALVGLTVELSAFSSVLKFSWLRETPLLSVEGGRYWYHFSETRGVEKDHWGELSSFPQAFVTGH